MVKVVHVVGIMNRGGLETFVMNVVKNMNSNLISFDVLCTLPGKGDYDENLLNLGVGVFNIGDAFQAATGKLRFVTQYRQYKEWFLEHLYDVIHIHGSHAFDNSLAVKAALASGCKTVICHSHTNDGEHKVLNALCSVYLSRCNIRRMACSEQAGKWLFGETGNFEIIQNGIEVDRFAYNSDNRKQIRGELSIPDDAKVIVHTGRLVAVKNQSFLLDILAALHSRDSHKWVLILVGEGVDRPNLEKKARALGVDHSVHFLGLRQDVARVLSAADIYIMPSLHEGLPLAAVEAQANGLPTLISSGMSPETKILGTTETLDLEDGSVNWANEAREVVSRRNAAKDRCDAVNLVKLSGFDISETVEKLKRVYLGNIDRCEKELAE